MKKIYGETFEVALTYKEKKNANVHTYSLQTLFLLTI